MKKPAKKHARMIKANSAAVRGMSAWVRARPAWVPRPRPTTCGSCPTSPDGATDGVNIGPDEVAIARPERSQALVHRVALPGEPPGGDERDQDASPTAAAKEAARTSHLLLAAPIEDHTDDQTG